MKDYQKQIVEVIETIIDQKIEDIICNKTKYSFDSFGGGLSLTVTTPYDDFDITFDSLLPKNKDEKK